VREKLGKKRAKHSKKKENDVNKKMKGMGNCRAKPKLNPGLQKRKKRGGEIRKRAGEKTNLKKKKSHRNFEQKMRVLWLGRRGEGGVALQRGRKRGEKETLCPGIPGYAMGRKGESQAGKEARREGLSGRAGGYGGSRHH